MENWVNDVCGCAEERERENKKRKKDRERKREQMELAKKSFIFLLTKIENEFPDF